MKLLLTGFGPFGSITDNPASRLARALDGSTGSGFSVVGREIPVSYARGVEETVRLAREHGVDQVLGIGVAVSRSRPELERFGRSRCGDVADVDGVCAPKLSGPPEVHASLELERWAAALGCGTSEDAGGYVCNAWLHQVRLRLELPVGFLHIPAGGAEPQWLHRGIQRLLTSPDAP